VVTVWVPIQPVRTTFYAGFARRRVPNTSSINDIGDTGGTNRTTTTLSEVQPLPLQLSLLASGE